MRINLSQPLALDQPVTIEWWEGGARKVVSIPYRELLDLVRKWAIANLTHGCVQGPHEEPKAVRPSLLHYAMPELESLRSKVRATINARGLAHADADIAIAQFLCGTVDDGLPGINTIRAMSDWLNHRVVPW